MFFFKGRYKQAGLSILFLLLFSAQGDAQPDFKAHVSFLASDSLHGRGAGTPDEKAAATYISNYLSKQCNAAVTIQKFKYPLDSVNGHPAANVVGVINRHQNQTIILCAHYDHLGKGSSKAVDFLHKNEIHPGADDNASGVAMIMELTRFLSKQKSLPFNVIAFFPSAHEEGLFGSEYFAKSGFSDSMNIALVMNFDMVGRLDTLNRILKFGYLAADSLLMDFFKENDSDKLHLKPDEMSMAFSDLNAFRSLRIPLLNFTTGTHQDYHRASDVTARINFAGMNTTYDLMTSFLKYLETHNRDMLKALK